MSFYLTYFTLIKTGILKKQLGVRLLMCNKIYDDVTHFVACGYIKTEKCKYLEKEKLSFLQIPYLFYTKTHSLYIVFINRRKVFFWRRWPLIKRVYKQTIYNANKMASFYVWNSSLGWYGLKLTFTSFTITCDKKNQHNFTDAYKRNYIIKSWQTENAFYLIWSSWCHE